MGRDRHSRRDGATCGRRDHPIDFLTVKRADQRRNLSMPARGHRAIKVPLQAVNAIPFSFTMSYEQYFH